MWNNFVSNRNSSFISQILVENRKKNGKQNFIIIVIGEQKHMYPLGHTHAQVFSNKRRALRKCVCVCVCLRKCALVWIWMLTHCNFTTSISKTRIGSWEFAARKKKRKRHGRRQRWRWSVSSGSSEGITPFWWMVFLLKCFGMCIVGSLGMLWAIMQCSCSKHAFQMTKCGKGNLFLIPHGLLLSSLGIPNCKALGSLSFCMLGNMSSQ